MFSATATRSTSAATSASIAYFSYSVMDFVMEQSNKVAKNQALHAAHAVVVFVERDTEWGIEMTATTRSWLAQAVRLLAEFGSTEWENVPLPFEGGKFNRKLCATYPQELR